MATVVPRVEGLCFGGDYNPEQWPDEVWAEDVALMREAGVTLVTVGVFAWAWLEPAEGEYDFGWLDRVLDLLHGGGISVDLATGTASPPPWFTVAYPGSRPVDRHGRVLGHGSRQAYCPSSPEYRAAALRLLTRLADRYADHPALALWHANNEYACHVPRCYCDASAAAFRDWLRARYGTLDALNEAWGTAFWSQRYSDWAQIRPPGATPTWRNPGQVLDFRRFSSDAWLDLFRAERDVLRELTPNVPVTTNLIAGHTDLDQWAWAAQMPVVSADHYVREEDDVPPAAQIGYAADLSRGLAGARPWLLMEHAPSAVNWQGRNLAKAPGRLARDAIGHIARGSEGAMYFQWRASRAGAEKWHSGLVPHAGTDSRLWREVVALGGHLRSLAEVSGSTVEESVALVLDFPSGWAQEEPPQPSHDMRCFDEVRRWHRALWRAGYPVRLIHPEAAQLSEYPVVVVPSLYLTTDAAAANVAAAVGAGAHLVVGAYSGIVDESDRVRLGGYPGALRDLLGVRIEEFRPLSGPIRLSNGWTGTAWSEAGRATDAEVLAAFPSGSPAVTRRGTAWYAGTRLADDSLDELLGLVVAAAGVDPTLPGLPPGVEALRRRRGNVTYLFLLNHGDDDATVTAEGTDLLTGAHWDGPGTLPAGGVAVLRREDS